MIDDSTRIGPYWDGDIPQGDIVIDLDETLTGFDKAQAYLDSVAYGEPVDLDSPADSISIPWDGEALEGGAHTLAVVALAHTGPTLDARINLGSIALYVMEDDGWYNLDSARNDWSGAPTVDSSLWNLLASARNDVIEYGTKIGQALDPDAPIPVNWKQAQLMEARALWAKMNAGADDQTGGDSFTVTLYPMDKTIKALIRPKRVVGAAIMAPVPSNG